MKVFLDASVLLAASGSSRGASRQVVMGQDAGRWQVWTSYYCEAETVHNLPKLGSQAAEVWKVVILPRLRLARDVWVGDKPLVLSAAKDRPVILTALAERCDVLLALDRKHFQDLLGTAVYGLRLMTPAQFLEQIRGSQAGLP